MPWNIDKPDRAQVRKPEVDRNPPPLLFFQAIGVDARKRADQGRLAVVDMPGSSNDDRDGRISYLEFIGPA
jgi:hypothetical protein